MGHDFERRRERLRQIWRVDVELGPDAVQLAVEARLDLREVGVNQGNVPLERAEAVKDLLEQTRVISLRLLDLAQDGMRQLVWVLTGHDRLSGRTKSP